MLCHHTRRVGFVALPLEILKLGCDELCVVKVVQGEPVEHCAREDAVGVRDDLRVRALQGLDRNGPSWSQAARRITRDLHTHSLTETLDCHDHPKLALHGRCLPGCGHDTSATHDNETTFLYRPDPFQSARGMDFLAAEHHTGATASLLPSGGGGTPPFQKLGPL